MTHLPRPRTPPPSRMGIACDACRAVIQHVGMDGFESPAQEALLDIDGASQLQLRRSSRSSLRALGRRQEQHGQQHESRVAAAGGANRITDGDVEGEEVDDEADETDNGEHEQHIFTTCERSDAAREQ
jgi:hypothetical protein